MSGYKVYAQYRDYEETLDLYAFIERPDGRRDFLVDIEGKEITEHRDGELIKAPTLSIRGMQARPLLQAIVDCAAKIGITPTGEPVLKNEMEATRYHLEDMRKLVFRNDEWAHCKLSTTHTLDNGND